MQAELNLQYDANILGYDRSQVDKVKSVFMDMNPIQRIQFLNNYKVLLKNIDDKKPHAMPWMQDSWQRGQQILKEVMLNVHYNCKHNKRTCVYHACMGSECRREVVFANGCDFGMGDCEIIKLKS